MEAVRQRFLRTALAVADFYLAWTPVDGIPYWDTGAPGLARMGDYLGRPADHEFDAGSFAGAPEPRIDRGQGNPVSGRQREIGCVVGG